MHSRFPAFDHTNPALVLEQLRRQLPAGHRTALEIVLARPGPVYLVGGIVRDLLLGRDNFDLDFVTLSPAAAFVRQALPLFEASFGDGQVRMLEHSPFGTVRLDLGPALHLDFATARRETYPQPAALPLVTYPVTLDQDLHRRDFTINAMAFSPQGGLSDPFSGLDDLRDGLLRVLHPLSFVDDPTRMVRGVRFAARLGYSFDPLTGRLLEQAREGGYFGLLSAERKRNELRLILQEADPARALALLNHYGLLPAIHPLLNWEEATAQTITRLALSRYERPVQVYLAALLLRLNYGLAGRVINDLRFSGLEASIPLEVAHLYENVWLALAPDLRNSRLYTLLHHYQTESVRVFGLLLDDPARQALVARYLAELVNTRPALNGDDLLRLGVPRGPGIGTILAQLRAAVLDGEIEGRAAEEAFVKKMLAAKPQG